MCPPLLSPTDPLKKKPPPACRLSLPMEEHDDEVCEVCLIGDSEADNQIVFCDGKNCHVTVHQYCYGVEEVPSGNWYCATCAAGLNPTTTKCELCPVVGGAMKVAVGPGTGHGHGSGGKSRRGPRDTKWVHVTCAMWIPETHFGDAEAVDLVSVGGAPWVSCVLGALSDTKDTILHGVGLSSWCLCPVVCRPVHGKLVPTPPSTHPPVSGSLVFVRSSLLFEAFLSFCFWVFIVFAEIIRTCVHCPCAPDAGPGQD
jgi:hypothetical protein